MSERERICYFEHEESFIYIYIFFVLFYQAFLSADCVKTHHYNEQNEVSQGERETDRESVQSV